MTEVTLSEAQSQLSTLIAGLPAGGTVVITDAGRVVATLSVNPARPAVRPGLGAGRGMLTIHTDDDSHLQDFTEYQ